MFYSTEILTNKKGGFGIVWLAATLGARSHTRRITRREYASVDIKKTCEFLLHPPEPLSLRLASNLMVGVSRVYGQQVNFYASDVSAVLVQVKYSFSQALDASASKLVGQARTENITLGGNLPENLGLAAFDLLPMKFSHMIDNMDDILGLNTSTGSKAPADMSAWLLNVDADPKNPARDDVLSLKDVASVAGRQSRTGTEIDMLATPSKRPRVVTVGDMEFGDQHSLASSASARPSQAGGASKHPPQAPVDSFGGDAQAMVFGDMFSLDYAADGIPDLPATGGVFAGTADNNVWADCDLPDRGPDMPMDDAVFPDNATVVSGAPSTHVSRRTNATSRRGKVAIVDNVIAMTRAEVSALIRNPTPLLLAPEDRRSNFVFAETDGMLVVPTLAAGPALDALLEEAKHHPMRKRGDPAVVRALFELPNIPLEDPQLIEFWEGRMQFRAPGTAASAVAAVAAAAPMVPGARTTPGKRRAVVAGLDGAAADENADAEPSRNRRRLEFDAPVELPRAAADVRPESQGSGGSSNPVPAPFEDDYQGGGGYDDVEQEVGRLGTSTEQPLSFEMDMRKDLPWASPSADRLARRRLSAARSDGSGANEFEMETPGSRHSRGSGSDREAESPAPRSRRSVGGASEAMDLPTGAKDDAAGDDDRSETASAQFLEFLVRIKGDQPTVKFTDIVPKDVGRYVAAAAFQNVLFLATRNLLQPAQARPFGPISIRTL